MWCWMFKQLKIDIVGYTYHLNIFENTKLCTVNFFKSVTCICVGTYTNIMLVRIIRPLCHSFLIFCLPWLQQFIKVLSFIYAVCFLSPCEPSLFFHPPPLTILPTPHVCLSLSVHLPQCSAEMTARNVSLQDRLSCILCVLEVRYSAPMSHGFSPHVCISRRGDL